MATVCSHVGTSEVRKSLRRVLFPPSGRLPFLGLNAHCLVLSFSLAGELRGAGREVPVLTDSL